MARTQSLPHGSGAAADPVRISEPPQRVHRAVERHAEHARRRSFAAVPTVRHRDVAFAREAGDTLLFMDAGAIVEAGTPRDVLANPQHERTKSFLAHVL